MASTYIITWDVQSKDKVTQIKEKLKEGGFYCPIHANAWAIRTESKASAIRDSLLPFVSSPDKIFVIRSGTEAAWNATFGTVYTDWLKNNL